MAFASLLKKIGAELICGMLERASHQRLEIIKTGGSLAEDGPMSAAELLQVPSKYPVMPKLPAEHP